MSVFARSGLVRLAGSGRIGFGRSRTGPVSLALSGQDWSGLALRDLVWPAGRGFSLSADARRGQLVELRLALYDKVVHGPVDRGGVLSGMAGRSGDASVQQDSEGFVAVGSGRQGASSSSMPLYDRERLARRGRVRHCTALFGRPGLST